MLLPSVEELEFSGISSVGEDSVENCCGVKVMSAQDLVLSRELNPSRVPERVITSVPERVRTSAEVKLSKVWILSRVPDSSVLEFKL